MAITINPNRIDIDEAYMRMAEIWAQRSKANRLQVGALIVKGRRIISDGYNGMPSGDADDVCEYYASDVDAADGVMSTKPEVLHAESNAITKIAHAGGEGAAGSTLYVTQSPCLECAKLIRQSGISRVVYRHRYRIVNGIDFLQTRGIPVEQLKETP